MSLFAQNHRVILSPFPNWGPHIIIFMIIFIMLNWIYFLHQKTKIRLKSLHEISFIIDFTPLSHDLFRKSNKIVGKLREIPYPQRRHIWAKIVRISAPPMGTIQNSVTFGRKLREILRYPWGRFWLSKLRAFVSRLGEN